MSENLPSQKGVLLGGGVLNVEWWPTGGANGAVMGVYSGCWKMQKLHQGRKKKRGCYNRELSQFVTMMVDGCGNANSGMEELVVAHGNAVVERKKEKWWKCRKGGCLLG